MTKKEKDIRKLLDLTQTSDLSKNLIETFTEKIKVPKELLNRVKEILLSKENMEELNTEIVLLYSINFTHQEIKDIITFYESKTGKRLLSKISAITLMSMNIGTRWGARIYDKCKRQIDGVITEYVIGKTTLGRPVEQTNEKAEFIHKRLDFIQKYVNGQQPLA